MPIRGSSGFGFGVGFGTGPIVSVLGAWHVRPSSAPRQR
jgi:hypothetical protein